MVYACSAPVKYYLVETEIGRPDDKFNDHLLFVVKVPKLDRRVRTSSWEGWGLNLADPDEERKVPFSPRRVVIFFFLLFDMQISTLVQFICVSEA